MNVADQSFSPEHNEGLLTPEYLEALAQEVNYGAKKSEIVYDTPNRPAPTIEQKVEAIMQGQMQSIANDAATTARIYDYRLQEERARYIERKKKGFLVGPVIRYLFDEVLKFPTNDPRPAVTLVDIQRQAGAIGGSVLPSGMGEKNYFWFNPEATMNLEATSTINSGEYVFMQMRGEDVISHLRYPVTFNPMTKEAHVSKVVSRDLTSNTTNATIDLIPNQHRELDREELQDLAVTVDTATSLLAKTWDIELPKESSNTQAVGMVYEFNPQITNPVEEAATAQRPGQVIEFNPNQNAQDIDTQQNWLNAA